MQQQIQLQEIAAPQTAQIRVQAQADGEVPEEIQKFLRAVDSYPARVAKEPRVTFQQHLGSLFAASRDRDGNDHYRRDLRLRRY